MDNNNLLGTICRLYVSKITNNGVYLSPLEDSKIQILLPKGQVPEGTQQGDIFDDIFIYKDSEDRIIATTTTPKLTLGKFAKLTVKEVTSIGAFLNWGLSKDLLLPFKEQTDRVNVGDEVLVALYIDKSNRLCGTMHVYNYLDTNSPYQLEDHVTGYAYEIIENFGVFVAVDYRYSALIPRNEITKELHVGEIVSARIKEIREDGKLTLSLKEKVPVQMGIDADMIIRKLNTAGGFLPFHDKTSPEIIKREFNMSKNAFKRAIGRLMKEQYISITDEGIRKIESAKPIH